MFYSLPPDLYMDRLPPRYTCRATCIPESSSEAAQISATEVLGGTPLPLVQKTLTDISSRVGFSHRACECAFLCLHVRAPLQHKPAYPRPDGSPGHGSFAKCSFKTQDSREQPVEVAVLYTVPPRAHHAHLLRNSRAITSLYCCFRFIECFHQEHGNKSTFRPRISTGSLI